MSASTHSRHSGLCPPPTQSGHWLACSPGSGMVALERALLCMSRNLKAYLEPPGGSSQFGTDVKRIIVDKSLTNTPINELATPGFGVDCVIEGYTGGRPAVVR